MSFIGFSPEKSKSEILDAESIDELLESGYSEHDLRRDWYAVTEDFESHFPLFDEGMVSGIRLERDGDVYDVIGVAHGIKGTDITYGQDFKSDLGDFVSEKAEDGVNVFYEQCLDEMLPVEGIEMDDQSWAVEKAAENGMDYAREKSERIQEMKSRWNWVKLGAETLCYAVADRFDISSLIANSSNLREAGMFLDSLASIQSEDMEIAQKTIYRNQLPEPLETELSDDFEKIRKSGRSKRMADFGLANSGDQNLMLTGAMHMYQIAHHLQESEYPSEFQESNLDFDSWREQELQPLI